MRRYLLASSLVAAAALACVDVSNSGQLLLVVAPVLDSIFVGDTLPPRSVYLLDGTGNQRSPGPVIWSIVPDSVASIDSVTGKVVGLSKGIAVVIATAGGVQSAALVAVSRPLDLTLQMDTIFLMPNDTFTVPFAIKQQTPGATTRQFDASPMPGVYTIDAATGLVTALASGGPVRYVARLTDGTNSVVDSGAVVVLSLADTSGAGRFFMTAFGTAIRHRGGGALALNYTRLNGKLAFRLVDSTATASVNEHLIITLPDSVLAAGTFEIDSISPQEATTQISQLSAFCQPKHRWALWYSFFPTSTIRMYSHGTSTDSVAGELSITQYVSAPGGAIISGRYLFRAQRTDLYDDPLGAELVRGTFVAPLKTYSGACSG
jgi:hypothetical protein